VAIYEARLRAGRQQSQTEMFHKYSMFLIKLKDILLLLLLVVVVLLHMVLSTRMETMFHKRNIFKQTIIKHKPFLQLYEMEYLQLQMA
jgi:hypothetical protein